MDALLDLYLSLKCFLKNYFAKIFISFFIYKLTYYCFCASISFKLRRNNEHYFSSIFIMF